MSNVLTRSDLAILLHDAGHGGKARARAAVDALFDGIACHLANGVPVHIKGLGRFEVVATARREARNPKTQEVHDIPAGRRVRFYPSIKLRHLPPVGGPE